MLGRGAFATVWFATPKDVDGATSATCVAVKVIDKPKSLDCVAKSAPSASLHDEVTILRNLEHRNVVRILEVYDSTTSRTMAIVMEHINDGELFDMVERSKEGITERGANGARVLFRQIVTGVGYIHEQGVCHRDLKLSNILMHRDTDGELTVKLADFGLAASTTNGDRMRTAQRGSPAYMAPEVFGDGAEQVERYTCACDMWSLGVLLFTMLCRTLPWSVESGDMQNAQIQTASVQWLPSAERAIPLSEEAKDLITKLLRVDVSQRLTPEQILDGHEWLRPNLDSAGEDAVAAVHARGGGGSGANGASGGASGGASSGGESPAKRARKE